MTRGKDEGEVYRNEMDCFQPDPSALVNHSLNSLLNIVTG